MVHFLFAVGLFFTGSCIGSFCGVLMERDIKKSFLLRRSQCIGCTETLRWYELMPLVSYFLQHGECRRCHRAIPSWVIGIEVIAGLVWMFFGTLFWMKGYSLWSIGSHLTILTMLLMLAIEDIKTCTIPDRLSLPMIGIVCLIIALSIRFSDMGILFAPREVILGGIVGMMFYLVQMMIPGILFLLRKKRISEIFSVLLLPILFPFWLGAKALFGEKRADRLIPSAEKIDYLPAWVGGGDVRLGILLGMIAGPVYFWWIIGIGYTIGTLFWLVSRVLGKDKIDILPVAPLLFLGFCVTWLLLIFA